MRDPCPRCGAERPSVGACPACGFQPEHPGVLASYARAVGELVEKPRAFVVFLVPVLVLLSVQALLFVVGDPVPEGGLGVPGAVAGVAGFFLQVVWYLLAVAVVVPVIREGVPLGLPSGSMVGGAVAGALVVVAPWALISAILVTQQGGAWGAMGLLSAAFLLVASLFLAGRAVGMPVEGALHERSLPGVVGAGSRRGRENGGLGLVFLAVLMFALVPLSLGVASALGGVELEPGLLVPVWGVSAWVLGAWIGAALSIGLVGEDPEAELVFTCPRCGGQAVVRSGRARCACGIEGPFYEGDPASRPS